MISAFSVGLASFDVAVCAVMVKFTGFFVADSFKFYFHFFTFLIFFPFFVNQQFAAVGACDEFAFAEIFELDFTLKSAY